MKQPKSSGSAVTQTSRIYLVPINKMRVAPVHITQREFRPAWGRKLAAELDLNRLGIPVMNHRDGIFWIIDGQHRMFALRENGFADYEVNCEVFDGLSDEEAANVFLGRNDSKAVAQFDKFQVSCTAADPRATAIRRAVESQGVKISRALDENCVSAIASLGRVFDLAGGGNTGEIVVGQVIRTIKNAFGGDPAAFDGQFIVGLGCVYNRYNGKTNERELATRLATTQHGVRGILRRAEAQRMKTGNQKSQCIASTVVDIYNRGAGPRAKDRLPSWWREGQVA
jgi:hypothetical protein